MSTVSDDLVALLSISVGGLVSVAATALFLVGRSIVPGIAPTFDLPQSASAAPIGIVPTYPSPVLSEPDGRGSEETAPAPTPTVRFPIVPDVTVRSPDVVTFAIIPDLTKPVPNAVGFAVARDPAAADAPVNPLTDDQQTLEPREIAWFGEAHDWPLLRSPLESLLPSSLLQVGDPIRITRPGG